MGVRHWPRRIDRPPRVGSAREHPCTRQLPSGASLTPASWLFPRLGAACGKAQSSFPSRGRWGSGVSLGPAPSPSSLQGFPSGLLWPTPFHPQPSAGQFPLRPSWRGPPAPHSAGPGPGEACGSRRPPAPPSAGRGPACGESSCQPPVPSTLPLVMSGCVRGGWERRELGRSGGLGQQGPPPRAQSPSAAGPASAASSQRDRAPQSGVRAPSAGRAARRRARTPAPRPRQQSQGR